MPTRSLRHQVPRRVRAARARSAAVRCAPRRHRDEPMPTVEIDGQTIEVEDGLTVIQAADRLGIEIPHYCWHPGLSIAGNCRMCLVEIEKSPKLQIACNTRVTDGMVVHTKSEKTRTAQKAVLEFLLINHPIDCPVCDQAGECKLQEYYMDYDRQQSRVPLSGKVHKGKAIPIGPHVMLDQERCVLCSRCIRFLDEVTKTHELAFFERGDHNVLALAPGKTLDNPYSTNVADICPVGALTNRDFRFRARVWYLERAESLCTGCANGCNIEIYHREGRIFRVHAALQSGREPVLDVRRRAHDGLRAAGRRPAARSRCVRGDDAFAPAGWTLRSPERAERLASAVARARTGRDRHHRLRAGVERGDRSCCGGWRAALGATARRHLLVATGCLSRRSPHQGRQEPEHAGPRAPGGAARRRDSTRCSRRPRRGTLQALVALPHRSDRVVRRGSGAGRPASASRTWWCSTPSSARCVEFASVVLPVGTHAESDGTFTNHAGRVQRFRRRGGAARRGARRAGRCSPTSSPGSPAALPLPSVEAAFALLGRGGRCVPRPRLRAARRSGARGERRFLSAAKSDPGATPARVSSTCAHQSARPRHGCRRAIQLSSGEPTKPPGPPAPKARAAKRRAARSSTGRSCWPSRRRSRARANRPDSRDAREPRGEARADSRSTASRSSREASASRARAETHAARWPRPVRPASFRTFSRASARGLGKARSSGLTGQRRPSAARAAIVRALLESSSFGRTRSIARGPRTARSHGAAVPGRAGRRPGAVGRADRDGRRAQRRGRGRARVESAPPGAPAPRSRSRPRRSPAARRHRGSGRIARR